MRRLAPVLLGLMGAACGDNRGPAPVDADELAYCTRTRGTKLALRQIVRFAAIRSQVVQLPRTLFQADELPIADAVHAIAFVHTAELSFAERSAAIATKVFVQFTRG